MDITRIYIVENCYNESDKVYVGKTKTNYGRIYKHKQTYGSLINYTYIDEVNSLNKEDWKSLESYWIEQFRQWGFEVLNKNKGGGGCEFCSEITKLKIGLGNKGKIRTKKSKEKISKSLKNKTKEEKLTIRFKKQLKLKGRNITQEHKNKISKSNSNKPKPEGFGEKISKANKGRIISQYQIEAGIKARNKPTLQYNKNGDLLNEYSSAKIAAQTVGVHDVTMRLHLGGKYKTCKGYIFKYKEI